MTRLLQSYTSAWKWKGEGEPRGLVGVFAAGLLWYCFSEPLSLNPRDLWSLFCCWRRLCWLLCFSPGVLGWCGFPCRAEGAPLSTEGRMMVRVRPAACEGAARSIPTPSFLSPRVLESGWHHHVACPGAYSKLHKVPAPFHLAPSRAGDRKRRGSLLKAGVFLADCL